MGPVNDNGVFQSRFKTAFRCRMPGSGNNIDSVFVGEFNNIRNVLSAVDIYNGSRQRQLIHTVVGFESSETVDAALF